MSEFKPGDKVLVKAVVRHVYDSAVFVIIDKEIGEQIRCPLPSIHRDTTAELERLRAYVECQPCKCCYLGDGDVMTCARCRALGKEKS